MTNTALVIGGDSRIGSHLTRILRSAGMEVVETTRRSGVAPPLRVRMDLLEPVLKLPPGRTVFMVAAMHGFEAAQSRQAWRVNVDAQMEILDLCRAHGKFAVFVSSDAVEFAAGSAYGQQKLAVELVVRSSFPRGAVVRLGRIVGEVGASDAAAAIAAVGLSQRTGLHKWGCPC